MKIAKAKNGEEVARSEELLAVLKRIDDLELPITLVLGMKKTEAKMSEDLQKNRYHLHIGRSCNSLLIASAKLTLDALKVRGGIEFDDATRYIKTLTRTDQVKKDSDEEAKS